MADRIDLGPLGSYLGYAVRRAQLSIFDEFAGVMREVDLSPAQFSALVVVANNPGLSQGETAAVLGIQRTNFVAFVNRLQRRGLVERRREGGNRRSYALHLTDDGRTLLDRALALHATYEATLSERLGPGGHARLLDLLATLVR
jgi:DNA-binding MarR family transcriptional regulator